MDALSDAGSVTNQEQIQLTSALSLSIKRQWSNRDSKTNLVMEHVDTKSKITVHTRRLCSHFVLSLVYCSAWAYEVCTWINTIDLEWKPATRIKILLLPSLRVYNITVTRDTIALNKTIAGQIRSYRMWECFILSILITHHSGTALWGYMHLVGNVFK